jgi:multiple sugar transport system permease protein
MVVGGATTRTSHRQAVAERRPQAGLEPRGGAVRHWRLSRYWRNTFEAYLFLLPFLAIYILLLVFPFFKNIWISTFDWNLLEVAFNPAAKEYVGLDNYVRALWGRNIEWSITACGGARLGLLVVAGLLALGWYRRWWSGGIAVFGIALVGLVAVLLGFEPGERGRWSDRSFWIAVRNTFVFVALSVPAITLIALSLAVFLNHQGRSMAVLRALFYLPSVLSVTVITLIWTFMFSPYQGLIGNFMKSFGAQPLVWVTNPELAMPSIVIATVWWVLGFPMIVLLAGLQDIPSERYEAARLDGAGMWAVFRHITLPGLHRPLTFVVLYQVISQFQIFGQAHLMTDGGPGEATNTLVRYVYLTGFRDNELGRAAAMAFLLFCLMALASFLYLRMSTRRAGE